MHQHSIFSAEIFKTFIFMKQISIITTFFILVLCFSCREQENKETPESSMPNSAQIISSFKEGQIYGITISLGHSATNCSGCVMTGGTLKHVDCQGAGNACRIKTIMSVSTTEKSVYHYGIVNDPDELTDEDSFLMPDRSFYIIGLNGEFLNIPEQVAFRDEETGAFIFYDIFFSDYQAFENK